MNSKIITGLKKEILVIELPKFCDYILTESMIFVMDTEKSVTHRLKGSYTLLEKPDKITEEDLDGLVSDFDAFQNTGEGTGFYDYKKGFFDIVEKEIYWNVNPISKQLGFIGNVSEIDKQIALQKQKRRFDEAQEKTFDRNRTLIFVKN